METIHIKNDHFRISAKKFELLLKKLIIKQDKGKLNSWTVMIDLFFQGKFNSWMIIMYFMVRNEV